MQKCRALDLDVVENDEEHADLAWKQVQDANTYQIQVSEFPAEVCKQSKVRLRTPTPIFLATEILCPVT